MEFDITKATQKEIEEEINRGYFKSIKLAGSNMPSDAFKTFLYISAQVKRSEAFKSSYKIAIIEEYMPIAEKVWRLFIYDKERDIGTDNSPSLNLKQEIGGNQKISIYYDNDGILAPMDSPYFEIYDGSDIDRYYVNEYKDLYKRVIEILERD